MPNTPRRSRLTRTLAAALTVGLIGTAAAVAADWPQYRGASHDGSTTEAIKKWPAGGPKVAWRAKVGPGLGSFAVAGKGAYLFVADGSKEVCVRLDAGTGKPVWSADIGPTANDGAGNGGPMPRSTPAVDGDKVYVLSTKLKLVCLDAATGKPAWQHDLMTEYAGRNISWENAASPLVDGDKVFVAGGGAGQSLLAFNKATGDLAWKSGDEKITHASPTVATIGGVRQVVFYMQSGLVAAKADDGAVLWRYDFPLHTSHASSPIVGGKDNDMVYVSGGYGSGTAVCQVTKAGDKFDVKQLWKVPDKNQNVNHWTTPVHKDGYIYGIYGFKDWGKSPLKCLDMATGKEMWSQPNFGSGGGTILAGGNLVVQADNGTIVLVEANPKAYRLLGQVKPLNPQAPFGTSVKERCWTMAVVADGKIYARSTSEAVCLDAGGK